MLGEELLHHVGRRARGALVVVELESDGAASNPAGGIDVGYRKLHPLDVGAVLLGLRAGGGGHHLQCDRRSSVRHGTGGRTRGGGGGRGRRGDRPRAGGGQEGQ